MTSKHRLVLSLTFFGLAFPGFADNHELLTFEGKEGPGAGKHIVLMAGDEEYRSEESCPMLAKILSQRLGFKCTVLFSMSPDGSYIDPNNQKSMPGIGVLDSADLLIIGTRFRQLDDESYSKLAAFLNAGKPVIGFRTATHAFRGGGKTGDFAWAQFGPNILGEGWVNHHGRHGGQGAAGVVEEANADHPILKGVKDVYGPSDVYGIRRVNSDNATILLRGAVTETLAHDSKHIEGDKNDPMMPMVWLREYTAPDGKSKGKALCTTMGASQDFEDAGMRRLIANASLHLLGIPVPEKVDVSYVDPFEATAFGFVKGGDYFKERNLKPADFGLGKSPKMGLPGGRTLNGYTRGEE